MVTIGFSVDGEFGFAEESFQLSSGLFHLAKTGGEPGGGGGEGDGGGFQGSQRIQGSGESGVEHDGKGLRGGGSRIGGEGG